MVKQHDKGVSFHVMAKLLDVGKTQMHGVVSDHAKIMNLWDYGTRPWIKLLEARQQNVGLFLAFIL